MALFISFCPFLPVLANQPKFVKWHYIFELAEYFWSATIFFKMKFWNGSVFWSGTIIFKRQSFRTKKLPSKINFKKSIYRWKQQVFSRRKPLRIPISKCLGKTLGKCLVGIVGRRKESSHSRYGGQAASPPPPPPSVPYQYLSGPNALSHCSTESIRGCARIFIRWRETNLVPCKRLKWVSALLGRLTAREKGWDVMPVCDLCLLPFLS